ncbi:hypothetical protein AN1V17_51480 [Vallitalea sediminicola]
MNKLIRITIIVMSFLISYMIYRSEYNIKPEVQDIERAIGEFLKKDVKVKETINIDNKIVVYYTFGDNDIIGSTILHRGINFKYRIRDAGYGTRNMVLVGHSYEVKGRKYLAIMGTNYELRISEFDIETYSGEMFNAKIHGKRELLMIFETKEETYIKNYVLYDEKGKDITRDMRSYLTTDEASGSGVGIEDLLYEMCFGCLIIGFIISRVFKDKRTYRGKLKKEDGIDVV